MKTKLIAQRYSRAVMKSVPDESIDSLLTDVTALKQLIASENEFFTMVESRVLSLPKRKELIGILVEQLILKETWKPLFELLLKKQRISALQDIVQDIENVIFESRNMIKVVLKLAHQHEEETMARIKAMVSDILKKDVVWELEIDPNIIGGFVAEAESIHIDGSIRNNLIKFKNLKMSTN